MNQLLWFRAGSRSVSGLLWCNMVLIFLAEWSSSASKWIQRCFYLENAKYYAIEASNIKNFAWYYYALWMLNEVTISSFWLLGFFCFSLLFCAWTMSVLPHSFAGEVKAGLSSRFLTFRAVLFSALGRVASWFCGMRVPTLVMFLCLRLIYAIIILFTPFLGPQQMWSHTTWLVRKEL